MTGPGQTGPRVDGRCVLAALLGCLLVTVLAPPGRWLLLGGEAALVVVLLVFLRTPPRWLAGRLALLAPFLLMAVVSVPLMGAGHPEAPPPAERAGTAVLRALVGVGALAAALRACPPPELLGALARLRVPSIFVTLSALMLRYLGLLEEEAVRMCRARDLRGTPRSVMERARVAGALVGTLFVRSWERAERVSLAMQARGFTGALPGPPPRALGARDGLVLGGRLLAQALLVVLT